jgi:DNA polymerase-3 subunit delta'
MNIIGHSKILKLLDRKIAENNPAGAYIFSGPEQVGKFTIAEKFARSLIFNRSFDSLAESNQNNVMDLIIVKPEVEELKGIIKKKEIPIEEIRDMQKQLALFPQNGKFRIAIIDEAEHLTVSSQNALLKILEEPNTTSIIILVTGDDSKIIPTVKSRCQKIVFPLVSQEEIKKCLENKGAKNSDEITLFSIGRPGMAIEMLENKKEIAARKKSMENLGNIFHFGINQRLELAEKFSKNIPETEKNLQFWIWIMRDHFFQEKKMSETKKFQIIENVIQSLDIIRNTNANKRLVLENLLINL